MMSLSEIPFRWARQCNDNEYEVCIELLDKYEVSEEKQESLNDVTNRWNTFRIKYTSQDPGICFNEL